MLDWEVQKWIEVVLEEPFPEEKLYEDVLKDGVVLCKLMNVLSPGAVPKIATKGAHFKLVENITKFVFSNMSYILKQTSFFFFSGSGSKLLWSNMVWTRQTYFKPMICQKRKILPTLPTLFMP